MLDFFDLRVSGEIRSDLCGVLVVTLHAKTERLEALKEQERVERRDGLAKITKQLDAGLDDVRTSSEGGPVLKAVITRVGVGEHRELVIRREIKRTTIDDKAAN